MMKKVLFVFAVLLFSNGGMAATGTGHAQAELSTPLAVSNYRDVDFGVIAIDPAAGTQTVRLNSSLSCPATYVCGGAPGSGMITIVGAPDASVNATITTTATLDDGNGNTLVFDPNFVGMGKTRTAVLGLPYSSTPGEVQMAIGGAIEFTGNEVGGVYSSRNGTGYQVTVNY